MKVFLVNFTTIFLPAFLLFLILSFSYEACGSGLSAVIKSFFAGILPYSIGCAATAGLMGAVFWEVVVKGDMINKKETMFSLLFDRRERS